MQKSRQEIAKNNLEAQLLKLKQRTATAVAQTREAVELKEGYLLEVENLETELAGKQQVLGKVLSSVEGARSRLEMTEGAIAQVSQEAQNDILRRQKAIEVLDVQLRDKEAKIGTLDKEIHTLEGIIPVIQEQVENHKETAKSAKDSIAQEIEAKKKELDQITEVVEGAIVTQDNLITEMMQLEKAIIVKEKDNRKREEELKEIAEDYKKRSQEMTRKEADLKVYMRRVKRKYEELFPGRKLNI